MKHIFLATIIFCFLLYSCGGYKVLTLENDGDYLKIFRMSGNFIPVDKNILGPYGNFQISGEAKISKSDSQKTYSIIVSCLVKDGFHIKQGESLVLKIDGKSIRLTKNQFPVKSEEVIMSRQKYILELAWFDLDRSTLLEFMEAREIKFIVEGEQSLISGNFTQNNLENFRAFINNYVL
jgi:hypothetical protein